MHNPIQNRIASVLPHIERRDKIAKTAGNIGYIRVSSAGQNTERQLDGVQLDHVFEESVSAKSTGDREQLAACLAYCRQGDTLHVHSMDRLARNLDDLRRIVRELNAKGVEVRFHCENLTFTGDDSPMANLLLSMLGAVAEFERSLIRERQREGITKAKARGAYKGRKPSLNPAQIADLRNGAEKGVPKTVLARDYGISRESVYRYLAGRPKPLPFEEVMTDIGLSDAEKSRLRAQVDAAIGTHRTKLVAANPPGN